MTTVDDSESLLDIVGKYKLYKEDKMDNVLEAMEYNYTSRIAIMNAYHYIKIESHGEYWQISETIRSNIVKESWSLRFRSGKKFSWTAKNGTKVNSLITKKGNKFEFRHEPMDTVEYRTLHGVMEFKKDGKMVMTLVVEEVEGLEAVYFYRKLK